MVEPRVTHETTFRKNLKYVNKTKHGISNQRSGVLEREIDEDYLNCENKREFLKKELIETIQ
jgi:hypothetical protein